MSIRLINRILPAGVRALSSLTQQRAVANQAQLTGAANNLSAQTLVAMEKQAAEKRRLQQQLLGRSTTGSLVDALSPAVSSHLDDEPDHSSENPRKRVRGRKSFPRPPEQK